MELIKKTLHLNYSELKGDKELHKSYHFEINGEVDNSLVKEIGLEIAKLINKEIDNCAISTKTIL